MKAKHNTKNAGFSLVELMIAMVITLVLLGIASELFSRALSVRARESRKVDALASAQAALNVMSREIANSGFGIVGAGTTTQPSNGIIIADSGANRIHIRSNFDNTGDYVMGPGSTVLATNRPGEDITYFFDAATDSIVRYDPNAPTGTPTTSVIINRISNVTFRYYHYTQGSSTFTDGATPTVGTGRVRITVLARLDPVAGQPDNQQVEFTSDVTLRNSNYMLQQY